MARKKFVVNEAHVSELKDFVYQNFGRKLTRSFECDELSRQIKVITEKRLSGNTLRRFFGFLKTEFAPSVQTLNVITRYCGFRDWDAFVKEKSKENPAFTLEKEARLYLSFYEIKTKPEADMNFHNASKNIAFQILFKPSLLAKLSSALASNPVSQIYFFERFPYKDGLCGPYKRSLELYLQKKTEDAQIFGNSLLYLSAFLSNNEKDKDYYWNKLRSFKPHLKLHPFLIARLMGTTILHRKDNIEDLTHLLEEAAKWNKRIQHSISKTFWRYPYFQHMIVDYLNLAGLYKESQPFIRSAKHYAATPYEMEEGYIEALQVMEYIAFHETLTGPKYEEWYRTSQVFTKINPLFKHYFELQGSVIYYKKFCNKKAKQAVMQRIRHLIEKTGFSYFSEGLDINNKAFHI